ncbi:hypothetical protein [Nocardioides currus]|nr:hypothetical protein [Nocardioides currus]
MTYLLYQLHGRPIMKARGRAIETLACRAGPGILHKLRAVMADVLK